MRKSALTLCIVLLLASCSLAGLVVVQPQGDGQVGKDRWGYSSWDWVSFNSGATPNNVGHWYDTPDGQWRETYMQVSLASLPAASSISGATLHINILSLQGADTISNLYHAADSSGATGNASDQVSCGELVGAITASAGTGWFSIDVTDFIKNDLTNGYSWASFKFDEQGYKWMTFSSAEGANAPYLSYVPEPVTMSLLGLGGVLVARRKRQ